MKRLVTALFLVSLLAVLPPLVFGAGIQKFDLIFTGSVLGETQPCGCATSLGGLARRATVLERYAKSGNSPIAVDAGDLFFKNYRLTEHKLEDHLKSARILAKSLEPLAIRAVGIGENDLAQGLPFLQQLAQLTDVPFLCANLTEKDGSRPFEATRVVQVDGFTIGIVALLSRNLGVEELHPDLILEEPDEVAKRIIPELRKKADMVLLLSHLPLGETEALLKTVDGIDLTIQGHGIQRDGPPRNISRCVLVSAGHRGQKIGHLAMTRIPQPGKSSQGVQLMWKKRPAKPRPGKQLVIFEQEIVPLATNIPENPQIASLVGKDKKTPAPRRPQHTGHSHPQIQTLQPGMPNPARQ